MPNSQNYENYELSIANAEIDKRILKLLQQQNKTQNEYIESLTAQRDECQAKNSRMANYLIFNFGIVYCEKCDGSACGCEDCENGFKSIHSEK